MKNKINKSCYLFMVIIVLVLYSCQESTSLVYYDENAPAPSIIDINTITIKNFPGKSVIKYTVPNDENFLYLKAIYETFPGIIRQSQSSRFVDTLALEGFAYGENKEVKLYSVGKNKKESQPAIITVSPLISPLEEAFPSLNLIATFGGVEGSFKNIHEASLKVVLLADTANVGEPVFINSFVIDNPNATFSVRNLKPKLTKFHVYLMDRWGNKTTTKEYELTPLFEERLNKQLWKEYKLPSDFQNTWEDNYPGYTFVNLFSDVICPINGWEGNFIPEWKSFPYFFTIDLGVTVKMSRFNLVPFWTWIYTYYPRTFEVYGSSDPNPKDDLNGSEWKILGIFNSYKPSGDAPNIITQEDKDFIWPNGENFDIRPSDIQPDPYLPIRIIRFKIINNWIGAEEVFSIDELTIWGEILNSKN